MEFGHPFAVQDDRRVAVDGWVGGGLAFFVGASAGRGGVLWLCATEEEAYRVGVDISAFLPGREVWVVAAGESSGAIRAWASTYLESPDDRVVVISRDAVDRLEVSLGGGQQRLELMVGTSYGREALVEWLEGGGYRCVEMVEEPGTYAVRGFVVDVFGWGEALPVRVELDEDDRIVSLRFFDVDRQVSVRKTERVSLFSVDGGQLCVVGVEALSTLMARSGLVVGEGKVLQEVGMDSGGRVIIYGNSLSSREYKKVLLRQKPVLAGVRRTLRATAEWLSRRLTEGYRVVVFCEGENEREGLRRALSLWTDISEVEMVVAELSGGFVDEDARVVCVAEHELRGRQWVWQSARHTSRQKGLRSLMRRLDSLKRGDLVMHIDHGIARFDGLCRLQTGQQEREVVRLVFKDEAVLYMDVYHLDRIFPLENQEGVELSTLGSKKWKRLRQYAKEEARQLAVHLMKHYARRFTQRGCAFPPDDELQAEFEFAFPYRETPDQRRATEELKQDLTSPVPMDRLLAGDVGFGKTEVALRAVFKVVSAGYQVAVMAPTTWLAFQHYRNFRERLEPFAVRVEQLSRLAPEKTRRRLLEDIESGRVDVVVGTHALLRSGVRFYRLGLLVIDEEHRFGVLQKEKLKEEYPSVDVLYLSATPIPRTLQLALSGIVSLSVLETAPEGRLPIHTEVRDFSLEVLAEAVGRELKRGGQAFVVQRRIEGLEKLAEAVRQAVPDSRVEVAHGRLPAYQMERRLLSFLSGESNVLVCTPIVGIGIDVPSANTIVISGAHEFGLAELHQLRGRVGRSARQAYCYLLVRSWEQLSARARERLTILQEYSHLGAGFGIALRDLNLRGPGTLFGKKQSGFLDSFSYEAFQHILSEVLTEVQDQLGLPVEGEGRRWRLQLDLPPVPAYIPEKYVPQMAVRLSLYREAARLSKPEELENFRRELRDRFGPLPHMVKNLLKVLEVRVWALQAPLELVCWRDRTVHLVFVGNYNFSEEKVAGLMRLLDRWRCRSMAVRVERQGEKWSLKVEKVTSFESLIALLKQLAEVFRVPRGICAGQQDACQPAHIS